MACPAYVVFSTSFREERIKPYHYLRMSDSMCYITACVAPNYVRYTNRELARVRFPALHENIAKVALRGKHCCSL